MKILLLEDDLLLSELLNDRLSQIADVVCVNDGEKALDIASSQKFDLWLLDVNVPKIDGFELLDSLRKAQNETPAIFITAKTATIDLKKGFNIGADDYIKKPFDFEELEARILRIVKSKISTEIAIAPNIILNGKELLIDDTMHNLAQKEAAILAFLYKNKNTFVSYEKFCANLWTLDEYPSEATLRTYIKNLRKILGKDFISGARGEGWKLELV